MNSSASSFQSFYHEVNRLIKTYLAWFVPDKLYLSVIFRHRMGYWMNWNNPKSFNEKLQWLKLHDRNPEYIKMVDKYEVKQYVAGIIGEEHIIPTLALYNNIEEINFDNLPDRFVLKCTHDSGGLVICKDKSSLDRKKTIQTLRKALKRNYYYQNREWPYKHVKPRIIAEQYVESSDGVELCDYKFFCFNGKPFYVQVDYGRYGVHKRNIYDVEWQFQPFQTNIKYPYDTTLITSKPEHFDQMLDIARHLSTGIPHLRVDLYNINGKIYFGELTFFHGSGTVKFKPEEWDYKFGDKIILRKN